MKVPIQFKHSISPDEKIRILALSRIKGIGPHVFEKLLSRFKSVEGIFAAQEDTLIQVVNPQVAASILDVHFFEQIQHYFYTLQKNGINFVSVIEEAYPILLREIYDPPIVLYCKGNFPLIDLGKCLSVVGTRNASAYGEEVTRYLVKDLVKLGFVIVSGMAFGIDRVAHESALREGGRTIAVLSGRVDRPSPMSHYRLYNDIVKNGIVVSEAHLGTTIVPGLFPSRNRIIAGFSLGTVVIEAGEKSGALITAHRALEEGREVFSVPSNIFSLRGVGTNVLIQKGEAKLVSSASDIVEELGIMIGTKKQEIKEKTIHDPRQKEIYTFLKNFGPALIDEIAASCHVSITVLGQILSMMEINRYIQKSTSERYEIIE
jgi:DNA processing protein